MPILNFPSRHIDKMRQLEVLAARAHGVEDGNRLLEIANQSLVRKDQTYVISVMCSPDSAEDRARLNDAAAGLEIDAAVRALHGAGFKVSMDGDAYLLADKKDSPAKILVSHLENDWLSHFACGFMLRWIVAGWRNSDTRGDVSLNRAASNVEEWCVQHGIRGGGSQNIIRNIWRKYRSVAHLWASFSLIGDADIPINTPDGFTKFLSTAQALLIEASKIVPRGRRAGEALVYRDDAWAVPDDYVAWTVQRNGDAEIRGIIPVWSENIAAHDIRRRPLPQMRMVISGPPKQV